MKLPHWRAVARALHRDLGYFFFGATVIYAVSGLAINHRNDWNPSYSVVRQDGRLAPGLVASAEGKAGAQALLKEAGIAATYLKHYEPSPGELRVFYQGGSATFVKSDGRFVSETLARRPLLHAFNKLHYNPGRWWTWFADAFSVGLVIVAVTGLFLLRGKHGLTRRGGVLVGAGLLLPALLAILYL